jgi:hypothetical protein
MSENGAVVHQDIDQALAQATSQTNAALIGDKGKFVGPMVIVPINIDVDVGLNTAVNFDVFGLNGDGEGTVIVDQDIDQALVQETEQTNAVVIGNENEFGGPVLIFPINVDVDVGYNIGLNYAVVFENGADVVVDQDIDQVLVQETDQTNAVVIGDENEFGGPVVIRPTNINVDAGGNLAANQVWLV